MFLGLVRLGQLPAHPYLLRLSRLGSLAGYSCKTFRKKLTATKRHTNNGGQTDQTRRGRGGAGVISTSPRMIPKDQTCGRKLVEEPPTCALPPLWGAGSGHVKNLRVATANVDTVGLKVPHLDAETEQSYVGRLDYLDRTFHDARLDIVGLQEHRWTGDTVTIISREHYMFILAPAKADGQQGVGLAVKHRIYASLYALHSYNPRVLRARFFGKSRSLSIIVGYAPTNSDTETDANRQNLYDTMRKAQDDITPNGGSQDVKVILMDANAETGNNPLIAPRIIGPHGAPAQSAHPELTPNGRKFLKFCTEGNWVIGYSWFKKPSILSQCTFFPAIQQHPP